jgi:hypothetical protein
MKIQPKYIRLLGDALIPLLGYFLWDWSLYFILIFYFFDLLINEVLMHFKSRKIVDFEGGNQTKLWITKSVISISTFISFFILIHFALSQRIVEIHFVKEFIAFLRYEELGIQQGFILIPLLVLMGVQSYKLEFVLRGKHRMIPLKKLWNGYLIGQGILLGFTVLGSLLLRLVNIPDYIIILSIVLFSSLYAYFFKYKD